MRAAALGKILVGTSRPMETQHVCGMYVKGHVAF
jgi:hypothetical protein